MDMIIAVICVLVLGLAVAQFFLTAGAFKQSGRGARAPLGEASPGLPGAAKTRKSRHGEENSSDSGDSGSGGGGDVGGGGEA